MTLFWVSIAIAFGQVDNSRASQYEGAKCAYGIIVGDLMSFMAYVAYCEKNFPTLLLILRMR
jgi:hypothetical protein